MLPDEGSECQITHLDRDSISISVTGELDVVREHELLNLIGTLDLLPATVVELDMSDVSFVDSRGFNSILKTQVYLRGRRCDLLILRPRKHLLRLIEVMGCADVLTVVDDPDRERRPGQGQAADELLGEQR